MNEGMNKEITFRKVPTRIEGGIAHFTFIDGQLVNDRTVYSTQAENERLVAYALRNRVNKFTKRGYASLGSC